MKKTTVTENRPVEVVVVQLDEAEVQALQDLVGAMGSLRISGAEAYIAWDMLYEGLFTLKLKVSNFTSSRVGEDTHAPCISFVKDSAQ